MLPKLFGRLSCRIPSATRNLRALTIELAIAVSALAVNVTPAGSYAGTGGVLQTVPDTFFALDL